MNTSIRAIFVSASALVLALVCAQAALAVNLQAGANPEVVVNVTTNRIYAVNEGSHDVTVIDGVTNATVATVTVGTTPVGAAINPVTNKIYVANYGSERA